MGLEFLGANLKTKGGEKVSHECLKGKKTIGLYFSAHWCPPCRAFTPVLAEFYKKHHESKNLEIIFISSDRDQASFDEYWGSMPWMCIDFEDRTTKGELAEKYEVRGIPCLILLNADGEIISKDGRGKVSQDAEGSFL